MLRKLIFTSTLIFVIGLIYARKNSTTDIDNKLEILNSIKEQGIAITSLVEHLNTSFHEVEVRKGRTVQKHPGTIAYPRNCEEATMATGKSGLYLIQVKLFNPNPFYVYCNDDVQTGDWIVIQRRQDGTIDFYRNWQDYKNGFGDLRGEFFIGLDKLHALTHDAPQELLIQMESFQDVKRYAKYDSFAIGSENDSYVLNVLGNYIGTAKDSLTHHGYMSKFSTKDRDNDIDSRNCAAVYRGAWWYKNCHYSNLNGKYYKKGETVDFGMGIEWTTFTGSYSSLKFVEMMIRPKRHL